MLSVCVFRSFLFVPYHHFLITEGSSNTHRATYITYIFVKCYSVESAAKTVFLKEINDEWANLERHVVIVIIITYTHTHKSMCAKFTK